MDHPAVDQPAVQSGRSSLREWHRRFDERKIAGVCAGIAHQMDLPLTLVRAAFVVLAVVPGFSAAGVFLYLALWFLMPANPGASSGLDRVVDLVSTLSGSADREIGGVGDIEPDDHEPSGPLR